jgi:hypothetical protein
MRTKRDIGTTKMFTNTQSVVKQAGKTKNPDNLGEEFVRYVTQIKTVENETPYTQNNDPFRDYRFDNIMQEVPTKDIQGQDTEKRCDETLDSFIQQPDPLFRYTKFHLEDDEMLMELMMHLSSDCPDMMRNKQQLLDHVSRLFDQITK